MVKLIIMRKLNLKRGFSLIEMLVVVGIVIFLAGMVIVYSNSTGRKMMLYAEQSKVAGVLNRAKSLALQKYSAGSGVSACAFGVEFNLSGTYKIFRVAPDQSGNCDVNSNYTYMDEFTLSSGVQFVSFPPNNRVIFVAPYLMVYNSGDVVMSDQGSASPIDVKINITAAGGISLSKL